MGAKLDLSLAVLNGLVGDHLVQTKNALATDLGFVHAGAPLPCTKEALAAALPNTTRRIVILVHGLMCTETVFAFPDGSDYGSKLAEDRGYTPLYVRYNSGRAIADNGVALDALLTALVRAYPSSLDEILLLGFSMGGLVLRAACHTASVGGASLWLPLVRRAIYVGTPHRGSPLERAGRVLVGVLRAVPDPVTRLLAAIGDLRSSGLKDLGDADLRHEDRARRSALSIRDPEHPVPLLASMRHYLAAGAIANDPRLALWFGDALVPIPSGTSGACVDPETLALPPDHVAIFPGTSHVRLAHDPAVYERILGWTEART